MPNHPNRNWRARMRADRAKWLQSSEAHVLMNVPMREATPDALRKRFEKVYESAYRDGRNSK